MRKEIGNRDTVVSSQTLAESYLKVRDMTEKLCEPLTAEDCAVQSLPDASPVKWHLAHVTWFFETFVLLTALRDYTPFHPQYHTLFNSYYQSLGSALDRRIRGLLTRPGMQAVYSYRAHVDEAMLELFERTFISEGVAYAIETGLHHEQQHQELILTDIKHAFASNPLFPAYHPGILAPSAGAPPMEWDEFPAECLAWIGHGGEGFGFDSEFPRHRVFLKPFRLASRLVTNGEFLAFMEDGGYRRPELWLSDGWSWVLAEKIKAPLYWHKTGGTWQGPTLCGLRNIDENEPVCHVSYYEAEAYARWAKARLPSEQEWETAAGGHKVQGNLLESGRFHPAALDEGESPKNLSQLFGDVWEWTSSAYLPYPGYRRPEGPLGEYNGKFMCNQMVLRGGSCVTPQSHIRATYRNFFYPSARWQFTGIRLARDL